MVPVEPAPPAKRSKAKAKAAELAKVEDETPPEPETVVLDADWDHERIEFRGDDLAIRKPTRQAVSGLSTALTKYVPVTVQNDMVGLFIARHLAADSYGHVMSRMMNPDDTEYTADTVGVLMRAIIATMDIHTDGKDE